MKPLRKGERKVDWKVKEKLQIVGRANSRSRRSLVLQRRRRLTEIIENKRSAVAILNRQKSENMKRQFLYFFIKSNISFRNSLIIQINQIRKTKNIARFQGDQIAPYSWDC